MQQPVMSYRERSKKTSAQNHEKLTSFLPCPQNVRIP